MSALDRLASASRSSSTGLADIASFDQGSRAFDLLDRGLGRSLGAFQLRGRRVAGGLELGRVDHEQQLILFDPCPFFKGAVEQETPHPRPDLHLPVSVDPSDELGRFGDLAGDSSSDHDGWRRRLGLARLLARLLAAGQSDGDKKGARQTKEGQAVWPGVSSAAPILPIDNHTAHSLRGRDQLPGNIPLTYRRRCRIQCPSRKD